MSMMVNCSRHISQDGKVLNRVYDQHKHSFFCSSKDNKGRAFSTVIAAAPSLAEEI